MTGCNSGYHQSGNTCVAHSYTCPSGYQASSAGMSNPASTPKKCSCGATSGYCYKETHSHSYTCPSGYQASSAGMISPVSTAKKCSCGATSGYCYKESHVHSFTSCPSGFTGFYDYACASIGRVQETAIVTCPCGAKHTCYRQTYAHDNYIDPETTYTCVCCYGKDATFDPTCCWID